MLREVCAAIVEEFRDELLAPPQTAAEWRQISDSWMNSWDFPHVIGAIDGKHIACKSPANTGSDYFNYKGFFSVFPLAVVASDYKFLWIDVSGKGYSSDAHIYNASDFREGLQNSPVRLLYYTRGRPRYCRASPAIRTRNSRRRLFRGHTTGKPRVSQFCTFPPRAKRNREILPAIQTRKAV